MLLEIVKRLIEITTKTKTVINGKDGAETVLYKCDGICAEVLTQNDNIVSVKIFVDK
jgi:enamine deaminase RidA (YjgF/YER057c/UK114 family)